MVARPVDEKDRAGENAGEREQLRQDEHRLAKRRAHRSCLGAAVEQVRCQREKAEAAPEVQQEEAHVQDPEQRARDNRVIRISVAGEQVKGQDRQLQYQQRQKGTVHADVQPGDGKVVA